MSKQHPKRFENQTGICPPKWVNSRFQLSDLLDDQFVPAHIAPFFFFDGEEVKKLADQDRIEQVKQGLEGLLGIVLLRNLAERLRDFEASKRSSVSSVDEENIDRMLQSLNADEARLAALRKDADESNEKLQRLKNVIVSHSLSVGGPIIASMDAFRLAIRSHWHRGALALWSDWVASDQSYDRFVETLVTRRSEMPEFSTMAPVRNGIGLPGGEEGESKTEPVDSSTDLTKALAELGIKVQVKDAIQGPRITRYRVLLMNLADLGKINRSTSQLGLALNLGNAVPTVSNGDEAKTVFIDLPRPRSSWAMVGIDRLRDWAFSSPKDLNQLMVYAGVSVTGEDVTFDLASAPHLLVGGTTGSGKSVCLHSLLLSLLLRHRPDTLQLALIDPKQVEFAPYAKLPNLYRGELAVEIPQAREFLAGLVAEMEARYAVFNRIGVTNIGEARTRGQSLPFIVVFIEEMADLIMQDPNIEPLIARLAQKARAAGIHLVLATQRPDAVTFSGLIRSNIPGRIALTVQKGTESNIILDEKGAENLLGAGDMLIRLPGENPKRAHGVFVKLEHVVQIVGSLGK